MPNRFLSITLVLLASPLVSLIGASSTGVWGAWFFLLVLLVWRYRPYLVEGIGVVLANVFMGIIAPFIGIKAIDMALAFLHLA